MKPEHVDNIVLKSMYTKKRVYKPWWIFFGQLASLLFRPIWERWSPKFLRKKEKQNENR